MVFNDFSMVFSGFCICFHGLSRLRCSFVLEVLAAEVLSMLLRHGMNQYFGAGFPKLRLSAVQFDCLLEAG